MPTRRADNPTPLRFYWVRYRSVTGRTTKLGPFDGTEASQAQTTVAPGGGYYEVKAR